MSLHGLLFPGTFEKNGEHVTYKQYHESRYTQTRVTDPQQPLLVATPKEKDRRAGRNDIIQLIPELCSMTGLTDNQRANFKLMQVG